MPFEQVVLGTKRITKIAFLLKKLIHRNTSDNIEKQSKIIVHKKNTNKGYVKSYLEVGKNPNRIFGVGRT